MDFVLNGQGSGSVAALLIQNGMDPDYLRPWIGENDWSYITVANGFTVNDKGEKVPKYENRLTRNANATLTKDAWNLLDGVIVKAARERLRAVADLRSAGLTFNLPNGWAHTVLQYQRITDNGPATVSMDALRNGINERPELDIVNLPLPLIHKEFSFPARVLATSKLTGAPLDTTEAEQSARSVAETAEELLIGTYGEYKFGGGSVWGLTNFPDRLTYEMLLPTENAWTPAKTILDILGMKALAQAARQYGPFILYTSPAWDAYLDNDYSSAKGDNTLRERIGKIDGIKAIHTLDKLPDYKMVLVQQNSGTIREVIGMDVTTIQWDAQGGLEQMFKVIAMLVPQIRTDINGNCGIVDGTGVSSPDNS